MDQAPYQAPTSSQVTKSGDASKSGAHEVVDVAPKAAMTPMMTQFFEIKAVNPGYMLFYRMGDFYELFFDDAEIASRALGIVLTKRGKHLGDDIPMCGVPVHAAQDYLRKLISLGHRVALCEQMENPAEAKKRGAKSVVRRDVVRLVTPGTLTEDDLLPTGANNFLASLAMLRHGDTDFALAWADISTGETWIKPLGPDTIADELARIAPAELIISEAALKEINQVASLPPSLLSHVATMPAEMFDSEIGSDVIKLHFPHMDPSELDRATRAALGALLTYVERAQKNTNLALMPPRVERQSTDMAIDLATRHALELLTTNRGEAKGSLRHAIDRTVTAAGSRLLARRIAAPLSDVKAINARLELVGFLVGNNELTTNLRQTLKQAPDLTRALTRLALERGGPRDLAAIGHGIAAAHELGVVLTQQDGPKGFSAVATALQSPPLALAEKLEAALVPEPPNLARNGGFIADSYDENLATERQLGTQSRAVVAQLQAELAALTDIKSLRIKHNNVLGFFVEVSALHGPKLMAEPFTAKFVHRQTLANVMRFNTAELAELEGRIARAQEAALNIELEAFATLVAQVLDNAASLRTAAQALAELDVTSALGWLAAERNYCCPKMDESLAFSIEGGRHPVVERTLTKEGQTFVANDCDLSGVVGEGGALWLITGPNMGGKSTFLRQNALIAILAQAGSFVPATSAHIGVIDRVFSRVGASDDIAHGRSTFMVEMVETAAILNRATSKSLVVLDEIGRGTATFDGLSIAWAAVEALHNINACRALFATHFHELTALNATLSRVSNHAMKVREWKGDVVFLHEVMAGAADRSYGVQVARLAGLPDAVINRAREVLTLLERQSSGGPGAVLEDLPLFTHQPKPVEAQPDPVADLIDDIRPDELTPGQAIDLIYQLKKARDADRRN